MLIVLDTNCLIQILPRQAQHRWLFDAILNGEISLAVSTEIILEYEETINSFYGSERLGGNVAKLLLELTNTQRIDVYFRWNLIEKDSDDDKYVDCTVASNAKLLITNDGHFNILKNVGFPKVEYMDLKDFEEIWPQRKED